MKKVESNSIRYDWGIEEIEAIYYSWENRGLSLGRLKKYLLKLMEWPEVPDLPILDLLQSLKDRIYEDSQKV